MGASKHYHFIFTVNLMFVTLMVFTYLIYLKNSMIVEIYISTFMLLSISTIIDLISVTFMCTVFLISTLVMVYSIDYMSGENKNKFMITMMLFISFMVILCLSGNLLWVMVGWDGLGVTSFALIMFFQNWKSFNSAMVTFLCNRAGDLFILSSIAWLMSNGMLISWNDKVPLLIQMGIVVTALSKSAQIPFSSWLPLAMAAPTPVSSLVHSSTLVTAGVYLVIRFNSMLSNDTLFTLMIISSFTVILAGMSAIWEYDFKKIIALSTLSHIGLMMMFVSIKDEWPAMAHLVTHSMFKSLLFMSAGSLIHVEGNIQDIRVINSVSGSNNSIMLISIISMMGLPFLSGFYSKELMTLSMSVFNQSLFFIISFMLAIILTCMYSIRLLKYLLSGKCRCNSLILKESKLMMIPMIIGSLTSCLVGGLIMWDLLFVGDFTTELLYNNYMKEVLVVCMVIGIYFGFKSLMIMSGSLTVMLSSMMFISSLYFLSQKLLISSSLNLINLDIKGWSDYIISHNWSQTLWMYKDMFNMLMNQPIYINNMVVKVCLILVSVNFVIINFG